MAITTEFKFTNKTTSTSKSITLYNMKETENYALVEDEPTRVVLDNTTAPVNASELLTYRGKKVAKVNTNLSLPQNSLITNKGVQYAIQIDADLVTTDSADASFRCDDPVIMYLTVVHPLSGNVTNDKLGELLGRLVSACQKEDGSWRFNELMRSALKPVED